MIPHRPWCKEVLVFVFVFVVVLVLGSGCTSQPPLRPRTDDTSSLVEEESTRARGSYRKLDVPGFLPAVLYVPSGGEPRPLVVAGHGAGGIPEAECEYWQALTGELAVLLCLRGARTNNYLPSGYYYATHFALEREFRAALRALASESDVQLEPTGNLYVGFSQGAIMGAQMIVDHAHRFSRLALIEGGFQYWNVARARKFRRNGGERVLFVCGTAWCAESAKEPTTWLRQAKVQVRLEYAPRAGHTPEGAVLERTRRALPWLTAEEQAWSR